jgi:leucyl aminopeptidase
MVREIISINVTARKGDVFGAKSDMLALGVFSDGKRAAFCDKLDKKLKGAVTKLIKLGDFKGDEKTTSLLYTDGKIGSARVLLVGLGESKKAGVDTIRKAAAIAASKAVELKAKLAVLAVHQDVVGMKGFSAEELGQAVAEGAYFGGYRYDEYVGKSKNERLKSVKAMIVESKEKVLRQLSRGVKRGNIVGQSQKYARTIANRPANVITPQVLAAEAKKLARNTAGLTCSVLNEAQLKQKKMGGILAVGQGSVNKPRLIVLKYAPRGRKAKARVALVGKAITFDSGGLSLKPGEGMHEMKFDKSGGMAVLGAMKAVAQLKPAVCVYGIVPSAENMPGSKSYRPGDIVTTYSGKTVEILNTDAEGRMLLCDAIHHAVKLKCDTIIDIATLTGACVVALGSNRSGLMGNDEKLVGRLKDAGERSGELLWHLPCDDEYLELMKSKIADLKNIGGKWAGACTAGAFLGEFAGKAKWAHIDMAGVGAYGDKKAQTTGSVGYGVRLLTAYVMNLK